MELIGNLAKKTCKTYASKVAVISEERSLTYQELYERSVKLANALLEKGLVKGDRIAILSSNRLECIEMDVAVALAGLVKVPLNYRLHHKEHKFIIEQSASLLLIGEKELIEPINSKIDTIYFGDEYENLLFNSTNHEVDIDINEDDLFTILYTSGTTGHPKGVMLSHRNYISAVLSLIIFCEINNEDIIGHVAPLTHGSNLLVHCALMLGAKQVVFNKFNPNEFIYDIHEHAISVIFLVPTMVNMMIHDPSFDPKLLASLKSISMAGSPIAEEKLKKALELLGPIFVETYGQTEAPSTVTCMPRHELLKRPLSCGITSPFVEMKIVDENGNERKQGEVGEVICRGSLVMKGYWNNEKATNETIKNNWLYTGDLGWVDKEGYLFLVDRKKDVIISGGANIYPREVEEVLNTHPAVKETCVFGIPNELWGESVFAHVVLQEGKLTNEEELIGLCKNELASYKKPAGIVFVQELPKNSYGKILKKELRDQYSKAIILNQLKGGN